MNHFSEDSHETDRDVIDLLAKAGPPPEPAMNGLLFSPTAAEIMRSVMAWMEQWRANLDNSFYFRQDIADEVFEYDGVLCSIVKNAHWRTSLETRHWNKGEVYGYNGYALFTDAPYMFDGSTGSLEEEHAFVQQIQAHGGVDLSHLDEHGWLCSFSATHERDRDNPGRTDRTWIRDRIVDMVISVRSQTSVDRSVQVDIARRVPPNLNESERVGPGDDFRVPCYWTNEVTGQLAPVARAFLMMRPVSARQLEILRSYVRQWIECPMWDGNVHASSELADLRKLRSGVEKISSADDLRAWLGDADKLGLNPLRA